MEIEKDPKFAPHCSIPSKFQRIIFPHPLKKASRGFGNNTNRFNQTYEIACKFNRDTGPGQYTVPEVESKSISTMGYSGITSKSERCTKTEFSNVGPGKYEVCNSALRKGMPIISESKCPTITDKGVLKIPFDETNPMSYVKPVKLKIFLKSTNPGPGEYDIHSQTETNADNSQWMFISQSKRGAIRKPITMHETYAYASGIKERNNIVKNCFTESSNRSVMNKLKDLSGIAGEFGYALNETYNGKGEFINYYRLQSVINEQNNHKLLRRLSELPNDTKKSNVSALNTEDDRFGNKIKSRVPKSICLGPGEYDLPEIAEVNQICTSFTSKIPKAAKIARNINPGPAYYKNLNIPGKYSFHRNFGSKWVG